MIDIIIPAYNAHDTIIKTLASIELQTVKERVNVIIVDDHSKKKYNYLLEHFSDINIKIVRLDKNMGPGYARERGIELSNNDYIYFLDSDDCLLNMFSLEILVENIENNDIVAGLVVIESENYEVDDVYITEFDLHGKLFKSNYIKDNNFKFNNSKRSEDNSFYQLLRLGTDKYIEVNEEVELYSYNKKSLTNIDKNYRINESKYLLDNIIWLENEASKRKYDKSKISSVLSVLFSYFFLLYIENINNNIIKERLIKYIKLMEKYKKYINYNSIFKKIDNIKKDYHSEVIYKAILKYISRNLD